MLRVLRPPLRSFGLACAVFAGLLAAAPLTAQADGWHGHGHGHGHYHWAPPVFYGGFGVAGPRWYGPRFYAPPPAYYVAPPPVYYAPPPPVYYAPAPVYGGYGYGPPGVSLNLGFQIPIHD